MLLLSNRYKYRMLYFSNYSDSLNLFLLNKRKTKLASCLGSTMSVNFFSNEKKLREEKKPIFRLFTSKKWSLFIFFSTKKKLPIFSSSSLVVGNSFERFETFRDPEKFQEVKLITLRLASPDTIRRWAETRLPNGKVVGLVHNANTLHHNTLKPLKGGLFCERIFGPTKDFQCACGIQKEKNFSRTTSTRLFCLKCDVEYTWSLKRRYQSGYIRLVSPVTHLWYVKETPSFIAVMLDMKRKTLDSIIYCSSTLTIDSSMTQLKNNLMYNKTDFNFPGVEESNNSSRFFVVNKQKQDIATSKMSHLLKTGNTSNNGMYIPTLIQGGESCPFDKNVFCSKKNSWEKKPEKSKWFNQTGEKSSPMFLFSTNQSFFVETKQKKGQQNWTNFWTIAYKIAQNQLQKKKRGEVDYFIDGIPKSFFSFQRKEKKWKQALWYLRTSLTKVKYAQKTTKLFKKLPKISEQEKRRFSFWFFFRRKKKSEAKKKPNALIFIPSFLLKSKVGHKSFQFLKKKEFWVKKRLIQNSSYQPYFDRLENYLPLFFFIYKKKLPPYLGDEPAKLHLSITTFPVFLYIVMCLFQHCSISQQSETVGFQNNIKRSERKGPQTLFVGLFHMKFFLKKQNSLMSGLILKLKDIMKYWVIFKNFIFLQSILVKNNSSLKILLGNLNQVNAAEIAEQSAQKEEPKRYFQKIAFFLASLKKDKDGKKSLLSFSSPTSRSLKLCFFKPSKFEKVLVPGSNSGCYKNGSFFEQFSFWAKEFQFASGSKRLILEKRFLMFRYFTKISRTSRFSVIPSSYFWLGCFFSQSEKKKNLEQVQKKLEPNNIANFLQQKEVRLLSLMKKHETLSSVNNFYSILRKNTLKRFFYQRELSFFLCFKLFQQLKSSKYAPSFSQFPQNFKVNEQQILTKQKLLFPKENLRQAKLHYFFGEIQSLDTPKFADDLKIFRSTTKWKKEKVGKQESEAFLFKLFPSFKAKNIVVHSLSDKITLLFDKLNNSLVRILLESKLFGIMNLSTMINNIKIFNKTWYSKRTPFSGLINVNLNWNKTVKNSVNEVVYANNSLERSLASFFSTVYYRKEDQRKNVVFSLTHVSNQIQFGLLKKFIRFEKLNMNLGTFNKVNNTFTVLKALIPIYSENYLSLNTALKNFENDKKDAPSMLKDVFEKFIYVQSIEKGYLHLFFSLYFNTVPFVPTKRGHYILLKRSVLLKQQFTFQLGKTGRVSPSSLLPTTKKTKTQLNFLFHRNKKLGTFESNGYLCVKKSNLSLYKYFRFIAIKSWNSFCMEEKVKSSLKVILSSLSIKTYNEKDIRYGDKLVGSDVWNKKTRELSKDFLSSISQRSETSHNPKRFNNLETKDSARGGSSRLYNNIYVLSNRYFWDLDEDLQTFLYYLNEPSSPSDVCIPTYSDRLLKSNLFRDPPPVLGGGLIQKFLGEFHPNECSKILMVLEKSLKTVNMLLKYCDDFLEARTLRLKRNYILRRLKYIRSGSYKFTDDFLRFSVNKTPPESSKRKFVNIGTNLNTTFKLKNLRSFLKESRPEWMVLSLLPVLPPDLRPILQIGNQVAASDLNRLYQKVIYRNERLKRFLKDSTSTNSPQIKFAYRLLQEAVDNLIDNGKGKGTPETDNRGLPLKSLTELLKGKKGRFRQNLLGKRVDYSGRSVIVVGPRLRLHECGLPKEMAIELFLPFLIQKIFQSGKAVTILGAKLLLKTDPTQTWEFLTMVMRENPVLLNRAPTLHRFGFQAFQPRLIEGKAILLHPLVCPAFNADFDGDQMAVHVPITAEAKVEAWKLMLARNHLLSASTGEGMLLPSQDMVLGCYYLTATNPKLYQRKRFFQQYNYIFTSIEEVLQAYESQKINLHSFIWLRWKGKFQTNEPAENLLELQITTKGQIAKIFKNYVLYVDSSAVVQSSFIKTTPGRVLFYNFLFNS